MKRDLWLIWSLAFLSVIAAVARADTSTTNGARVIENPTQDGDLKLRVNDGGTKVDAITITGSTSAVTIGSSSNATLKAAGTNNDLTLEAVGSGGAVVFKTNGVERGRMTQTGRFSNGNSAFLGRRDSPFQSVPGNTQTKVKFTNENYDINSEFSHDADDSGGATESRFTPTAAGYYVVSCRITVLALALANAMNVEISAPGSMAAGQAAQTFGSYPGGGANNNVGANATGVWYYNGSTDFSECWVTHNDSTRSVGGVFMGVQVK